MKIDIDPDTRNDIRSTKPFYLDNVLLCINRTCDRTKLIQHNLNGYLTDQDAFSSIRESYRSYKAPLWRLNRLSHVDFKKVSFNYIFI
jgi:hypothetical protein